MLAALPDFASDLRAIDRVELEGHEIAASDPCFVSGRIADVLLGENRTSSLPSRTSGAAGRLSRISVAAVDAQCTDGSQARRPLSF